MDSEGYYIYIVLSNFLNRGGVGRRFDKSNDRSIININHYLQANNVQFKCTSSKFNNANEDLTFECLRCGEIVKSPRISIKKPCNFLIFIYNGI